MAQGRSDAPFKSSVPTWLLRSSAARLRAMARAIPGNKMMSAARTTIPTNRTSQIRVRDIRKKLAHSFDANAIRKTIRSFHVSDHRHARFKIRTSPNLSKSRLLKELLQRIGIVHPFMRHRVKIRAIQL